MKRVFSRWLTGGVTVLLLGLGVRADTQVCGNGILETGEEAAGRGSLRQSR